MVNFSNKHRIILGVVLIVITVGAAGYAAGYYEYQQQQSQLQQKQETTRVVMCPVGSIGLQYLGTGHEVKNGTTSYFDPSKDWISFTILITINCYATYYYDHSFIAIVTISSTMPLAGLYGNWSYSPPQIFIPSVNLNTYDDPFSFHLTEPNETGPVTVHVTIIAYSNDTATLDSVTSHTLTV